MKRLTTPSSIGERLSRQQREILHETETYKVYAIEYYRLQAKRDALRMQRKGTEDPFLQLEIQDAMALRGALEDIICAIASGATADDTW